MRTRYPSLLGGIPCFTTPLSISFGDFFGVFEVNDAWTVHLGVLLTGVYGTKSTTHHATISTDLSSREVSCSLRLHLVNDLLDVLLSSQHENWHGLFLEQG